MIFITPVMENRILDFQDVSVREVAIIQNGLSHSGTCDIVGRSLCDLFISANVM